MTWLALARLIADTGLFVLIWIVQLVVYPGFLFYDAGQLGTWHPKYAWRITMIVFPLMTMQLVVGTIQLFGKVDIYTTLSMVLIVATWLITFIRFVPMHAQLGSSGDPAPISSKMVRQNWSRTILWTALFVLSILKTLDLF